MTTEQKFVTEPTRLLSNKQLATSGYSKKMNFIFDRKADNVKPNVEQDLYYVMFGDNVLQISLKHVAWRYLVSLSLLDLKKGTQRVLNKRLNSLGRTDNGFADNPEKPNLLQCFGKKLKVQFDNNVQRRRITLSELGDKNIVISEIDITLTGGSLGKEKIASVTPFDNPKHWFLSYKENCFVANGYLRLGDTEMNIVDGTAVYACGRGVLPSKFSWCVCSGATRVGGKSLGINLVWDFGFGSKSQSDVLFFDNKAYKLEGVQELKIGDIFRYVDKDKSMMLDAYPMFQNTYHAKVANKKAVFIQTFSKWCGAVTLPDGKKVEIPTFVAFRESGSVR